MRYERSNTLLYRNNHHNCINLTICGILFKRGVSIDYLWGQAALVIDQNDLFTQITPYYLDWDYYLYTYHDIVWNKYSFDTLQEHIECICHLLSKRISVGVDVDIYKLPYSIHYEKVHDFHAIEIIDVVGDKFEVCDHYFHYHGYLDFKDYLHALSSYVEQYSDTPSIFYFDIDKHFSKEYTKHDLFRVIKDNVNVMKGFSTDLSVKSGQLYLGAQAFPFLIDKIDSIFTLRDDKIKSDLVSLYYSFKEISNSRFNFQQIVKRFNEDMLAKEFDFLVNSWSVIANLLLKAQTSENYAYFQSKISKRLESTIEKELQTIDLLTRYLKEELNE